MSNSHAKVWNCPAAFELLCDRTWEGLAPTDRSHVRHCHSCNERVYLSTTPEEFVSHVKLGRCVSLPAAGIPPTDPSEGMLLGRISSEYLQELQAITARQWQQYRTWWHLVLDRDPFFIIPLINKNFPELLDFLIKLNSECPTERDLLELATELISKSPEKDELLLYLFAERQFDKVIDRVKTSEYPIQTLDKIAHKFIDLQMFAAATEIIQKIGVPSLQNLLFSIVTYELIILKRFAEAAALIPKIPLGHQYDTVLKIATALVIAGENRDAIVIYESFLVSPTKLNDKQKNVILQKIAELRVPTVEDPTVELSIARQAMTWSILNVIAIDGKVYALFGADPTTNPYRGDTDIQAVLPLLAIKKSGLLPPIGLPCPNTTSGGALRGSWSGGKVIIVPGVQGSSLISQAVADEKCRHQGLQLLGEDGFRMAEFHDGDNNAGWAGWDFWAEASALSVVKIGETRYWVKINDRPANPWCQTSPQ